MLLSPQFGTWANELCCWEKQTVALKGWRYPRQQPKKAVTGALSAIAHGGLFVFAFLPPLLLRVTAASPFSPIIPRTDLSLFQEGRCTDLVFLPTFPGVLLFRPQELGELQTSLPPLLAMAKQSLAHSSLLVSASSM